MRVFIDANVFVALVNAKDSTHNKALGLMGKLQKENPQFFTSSDVVKEAATIISQKTDHASAVKFLNEMDMGDINVIFVDSELNGAGLEEFKLQTSKNISCVDAVSFVIVKKYNIDFAFTFDRDFKKPRIKIYN